MPNGAKHWCYTINNPFPDEKLGIAIKGYDYCIQGQEVGGNGIPHVQGYIAMVKKTTLANMKVMLPRAHLEMMRGTPHEAAEYCKKDGDWVDCGVVPKSPAEAGGAVRREKFSRMIKSAKRGDFDDIEEIDPVCFVTHYHALKRIRQDYPVVPKDLDGCCGEWIYGATGVGKSRMARRENNDIYDKSCNKWWDGYRDEAVVLIDDFSKNHRCLEHHLKRWGDRYSFPAEHKGTTYQIRPKKVVITSNYSIKEIFGDDSVLTDALERRYKQRQVVLPILNGKNIAVQILDDITHFDGNGLHD